MASRKWTLDSRLHFDAHPGFGGGQPDLRRGDIVKRSGPAPARRSPRSTAVRLKPPRLPITARTPSADP